MDRTTAPAVRGVQTVTLHRIMALARLELLPELPIDVRNLNLHGREADPARADLIPLEWLVADNPFAPSAVMAMRSKYDYAYGTHVLEIVHVAGKRGGVVRLVKAAIGIADLYSMPLTGEIDVQNHKMAQLLDRLGCRRERVRWTLEPRVRA